MELIEGTCVLLPYDLENSRFRWQNKGEIRLVAKNSPSTCVVTILSENDYAHYEIDVDFKQKVGTKVTVLYDKELGKYFIGNMKLSNDDIIKEYFEYLACSKFFYYNLVGILAIVAYLGFPLIFSFYETIVGFWDWVFFIFVMIFVLFIAVLLSMSICMKFAKLMYYQSKKKYEDED